MYNTDHAKCFKLFSTHVIFSVLIIFVLFYLHDFLFTIKPVQRFNLLGLILESRRPLLLFTFELNPFSRVIRWFFFLVLSMIFFCSRFVCIPYWSPTKRSHHFIFCWLCVLLMNRNGIWIKHMFKEYHIYFRDENAK